MSGEGYNKVVVDVVDCTIYGKYGITLISDSPHFKTVYSVYVHA